MSDARLLETGTPARLLESGGFRALESYGAPASSWDVDFTDDADGVPAGWTTVAGLEVGPAAVISGVYKCPQLWWNTTVRNDTGKTTTHRKLTAEFVYVSLADPHVVQLAIMNNAVPPSNFNMVTLNTDGTWIFEYILGSDGGASGSWAPPGLGVPFVVEFEWNNQATVVKVDGVTLTTASFVHVLDPTSIYGGAKMGGGAGMRRWKHEDLSGAAPTAPDAPTAVSGTAGDTQVSLTWTAPASNGGSAITDYVVQYAVNPPGTWNTFSEATSTATSTTVTGLTNGTAYVFRVAAVNAVGTGAYSTASSPVTPTAGSGTVYTDTFNRADAAAPGLGAGWDAPAYSIASNRATIAIAGNDYARFLTDLGTPDHWIEARIIITAGAPDYQIVDARVGTTLGQNLLQGFINPGSLRATIGKTVSGTYTDVNLGSTVTNADYINASGFLLRLECEGSAVRLYFNGTLVASGTDTTVPNSNFVGLNSSADAGLTWFDQIRCGPLPWTP